MGDLEVKEGCRRAHRAIVCKSCMSAVQSSQAASIDLNTGSSARSKYFIEDTTAVHAVTEHTTADVTEHTQSSDFQTLQSEI